MKINILIFIIISLYFTSSQAQSNVKVSIYYESLCPDSIRFITTQLTPTYNSLKQYMTIDFLPYGKATHFIDGNGNYQFTCQHGDEECRGNKMQACALNYITSQDTEVYFINCVMGSSYPPDAGSACAASNGVTWSPINNCWGTSEGDLLLAAYGDRTHTEMPNIAFVPSIVYNDVFNQADQNESLYNFKGVVCRHLSPQPPECTAA